MPRFFFDLTDSYGQHLDDVGLELPDLDAVQQAVEMSLPRISAESAVDAGEDMKMVMVVRDEYDRAVLSASLAWTIERHPVQRSFGARSTRALAARTAVQSAS